MWYDGTKVVEKGALFSFVIGGRGIGKSFFWKKYCIDRFLETGEQFIYLRRYKEELKIDKLKRLFDDLQAVGYFTDNQITVKGREIRIDDKPCGYVQSLSTANIAKSDSFPQVETILYDEFLIETGTYHYLKNEPEALIGFYETVARNRPDVKVIFLSNAITITNPYFSYFKLKTPMQGARIWRRGEVLVDMPRDEEFIAMRKKSRFASLIAGTSYADYSIDNEFLLDSDTFIERKTDKSRCIFTISMNRDKIGLWIDNETGLMFASADTVPNVYTYSLSTEAHGLNTILVGKRMRPYHIDFMIDQFKAGGLRFENQRIKGLLLTYLSKAG